jgi:hypothetical protein
VKSLNNRLKDQISIRTPIEGNELKDPSYEAVKTTEKSDSNPPNFCWDHQTPLSGGSYVVYGRNNPPSRKLWHGGVMAFDKRSFFRSSLCYSQLKNRMFPFSFQSLGVLNKKALTNLKEIHMKRILR